AKRDPYSFLPHAGIPVNIYRRAKMARNDRYVVKQGKGWAVKQGGVSAPESVHRKQATAEKAAKATVRDLGGGEVRIQGRDGRWRDAETIPPARDPVPPRDKKH